MAYGYFKDLHKKAAFDKVLLDKVFKIAENPRDHASMAYKFSIMVVAFCDYAYHIL